MQDRNGGIPAWRLPPLFVSILLVRRVAATPLSPFAGCVPRRPRHAALDRRWPSLSWTPPMVRRRNGHADQLLDIAKVRRLLGVAERDRDTCRPGSRGAADAMHISFRHIRQIEIDDVPDAVDIDTPRVYVGRDPREHLPLAKCGKHSFALVLRLVAVDRVRRDTGRGEAAHHLVRAMLGAGEYESAVNRFAPQNFSEDRWLRGAIDMEDARLYARDVGAGRRDGNPGRVAQHVSRKF